MKFEIFCILLNNNKYNHEQHGRAVVSTWRLTAGRIQTYQMSGCSLCGVYIFHLRDYSCFLLHCKNIQLGNVNWTGPGKCPGCSSPLVQKQVGINSMIL